MSLKNQAAELVRRLRADSKAVAILAEWLGSGGNPVTHETADRRASICSKCPHNKPVTKRIENTVAEAIRKQEEIRHAVELRTGSDYQLNNCDICGCYLKLKVWVPREHLSDDVSEFPAHCWAHETIDRPLAAAAKPAPRQPEPEAPKVPVRPSIRIRREDAFGDVIQASIMATKMWALGYDVWWRCSDAARPALLNHPHIAGFIEGKDEPVDVNLDRTYEDNMDRKQKSMGQLFIEASEHQLKRKGYVVPDKFNLIPFLALTDREVESMRAKLSKLTGRIVAFIPRSSAWPARTISNQSVVDAAARIKANVVWAFPGDPPSKSMQRVEINGFRQLMALIAMSDVVVTPDTGPLHVAAAFNKPIVVVEQCIPASLRLSDQTDWTAVSAPLDCIRCGDFTCRIDAAKPPCQDVPPGLIAAAVNRKLAALDDNTVSVIIPVYKRDERLVKCLEAANAQPEVTEIIVALDGDCKLEGNGFKIIPAPGKRTGYGKTTMRGARASTGAFLIMLNDDCYLRPGCVAEMLETARRNKDVAVVGAQLWYPDGTIQHGGTARRRGDVGFGHVDFRQRTPSITSEVEMEFVTFAAALVRRSDFYEARGFDEEFDCYNEDSDLCLKMKQIGKRVFYNPAAKAIHDESQSTGPMKGALASHGDRIFRRKWNHYFQHNPANE